MQKNSNSVELSSNGGYKVVGRQLSIYHVNTQIIVDCELKCDNGKRFKVGPRI